MIMRTTTLIFVLTLCCTLLMGCKKPNFPSYAGRRKVSRQILCHHVKGYGKDR